MSNSIERPSPALPGDEDHALAARYAPVIRFDEREPFLPLAAGYTVFRAPAPSPSFSRRIAPLADDGPPAAIAIEYAIWWDWDIQHLYELEHVWVYVDDAGRVVHCEASAHGGYSAMLHGGDVPREGDRVVVCSEPGKHAFAPHPDWFAPKGEPHPRGVTSALAGMGGLLVNDLFRSDFRTTPQIDTLARTYLARHAFEPSYAFTQRFAFAPDQLVPWPALRAWIPRRIGWWTERLAREIPPEAYRALRVGHRGAAAHAPDNSLVGIEAAARLGADAVEIDVRLTRDGVAVASHDSAVRDGAGQERRISELTAADLAAIAAAGGTAAPMLDAVIARCRELRLGLYLEIKEGGAIEQMLARLDAHGGAEFAIVGSFRPDWLADVHALAPHVATSALFSAPSIDPVALAAACGASYVHACWERRAERPDELLTPEWIGRVRDAGLGIICWHEERPEVIAGLLRRGVDGICSDRPELLR
jgi:glycerophosphoryl diester phosphodiesterase